MGRGHEGTKLHKKWEKYVAATTLIQIHDEDSWLFSSSCNTTSLVLKILGEQRYRELPQKARERETNFDVLC